MSMHEALKKLRGVVPWLRDPEEEILPPPPPTALELAEGLVILAKTQGQIERESPTWKAVAGWAARELILTQAGLETAADDKAAALRSRARTLRDVLAIDERGDTNSVVQDDGPYVP